MSRSVQLRRGFAFVLSSALIVALVGCGGGGGGGGTPNPAPPTPAPPAPPPAPPPVRFTLSAVAPAVGTVYFDLNGNGLNDADEPIVFTNRIGDLTRGIPDRVLPGGVPPAIANVRMFGVGVDTSSGMVFARMTAPAGATVLSPLTTLIEKTDGDTTRVRAALRLDSRTGLRADTNPLTFDAAQQLNNSDPAIAQDAARITSIALELFGLASVLSVNRSTGFDSILTVDDPMGVLATQIRETGRGDLQNPQHILEILSRTSFGDAQFRQDVREAAAELLADYAIAVPDLVSDPEVIARFQLGFNFFIIPELDRLFLEENSAEAAQRVRQITPASLTQTFSFFANAPRPPSTGLYFPVPDYRTVASGRTVDLFGCASRFPNEQSVGCNDILIQEAGVFPREASIVSVSVNAANQARVNVALRSNGDVRISPVGGFTGYAFFDYVGRAPNGDQAVGRVYVRVTP